MEQDQHGLVKFADVSTAIDAENTNSATSIQSDMTNL